MLSGIKFVPRDQLLAQKPSFDLDGSSSEEEKRDVKRCEKRKHESRREKEKNKPCHSSSDDDEDEKSRRKRRSKRWYSSDEDSPESNEQRTSNRRSRRRRRRRRKENSLNGSDSSDGRYERRKDGKEGSKEEDKWKSTDMDDFSDDGEELNPQPENGQELMRKEMGLEWMLHTRKRSIDVAKVDSSPKEPEVQAVTKANPKELNPYLKDDGSGYPDDNASFSGINADQLLPSSVVGDGGASWRLKALKRAKEQATREGRKLDEVVEERWGSLGQLGASVAVRRAAPAHAHLHAIKDRRRGQDGNSDIVACGDKGSGFDDVEHGNRDYVRHVSTRHPEMRKPKQDYLSWRKNKGQNMSSENSSLISSAISSLNKFANDGNFMDDITHFQKKDAGASSSCPHASIEADDDDHREKELVSSHTKDSKELHSIAINLQALSANQLAAKVLHLRMKGKHEEAEKLSKEMEAIIEKQDSGTQLMREEIDGSSRRYTARKISSDQKKREEDADLHLARKIMQNKQYSLSGRADDEYDFDDAPSRKRNRKKEGMPEGKRNISNRILTQHERCQFCFESPSSPRYLVVAIANFTYMMLPQWQPVVKGHCCILPMQHESATRTVDNNVWEEIRNFKKCLIRMFAKQDKDVLFLETVIGLAQQRRHCLVECIPVPYELSKQAPMYFKKAIDEAEEEWGQHEMKKLIQTSGNLRHVIPENFSYFHVEFGLDRGFVHVIDDDSNFKRGFGLNVIRGLLRLPEEDMYRSRRQESVLNQKQAVATFAREWEPFDWTKELE